MVHLLRTHLKCVNFKYANGILLSLFHSILNSKNIPPFCIWGDVKSIISKWWLYYILVKKKLNSYGLQETVKTVIRPSLWIHHQNSHQILIKIPLKLAIKICIKILIIPTKFPLKFQLKLPPKLPSKFPKKFSSKFSFQFPSKYTSKFSLKLP